MCGGALKVTQHYFKGLWEVLWHQSAFSFLFRNPIPSVLDLGLTSVLPWRWHTWFSRDSYCLWDREAHASGRYYSYLYCKLHLEPESLVSLQFLTSPPTLIRSHKK